MDYYQPPAPIPSKQNKRNFVLILLSGCGCLSIIAVLIALFAGRVIQSLSGPERAVQTHIDALNKSELDVAYSVFTVNYRQQHTLDDFRSELAPFVEQLPLRNANFNHVNIRDESAIVEGILTGREGALFPASYKLIKEAGDWKIESFRWLSPGETQTI